MTMLRALAVLSLLPAGAPAAETADAWVLQRSTLTYEVSHPLHHTEGVSTVAKGKGKSDAAGNHFLVAVPVKSFDSGDTNRDSHMLEVTKAGLYPMIVVRVEAPAVPAGPLPKDVTVSATVEFAGKKVSYPALTFTLTGMSGDRVELDGVLPLSLKAYDIPPPSLLAVPIKDEVPVAIEMVWLRPAHAATPAP